MTLPWGHRALGLSEAEEARHGAWGEEIKEQEIPNPVGETRPY